MSDLISRSAVIEFVKEESKQDRPYDFKIKNIQRFIEDMPTAYDENAIIAYGTECYKKGREEWIEKVVTELDNAESVKVFGSLNSGNRLIPVKDAISIVRKGGVE